MNAEARAMTTAPSPHALNPMHTTTGHYRALRSMSIIESTIFVSRPTIRSVPTTLSS